MDETTTNSEIIYDKENISSILFKEICKTKIKLDICIKISDPFLSITTDLIIKAILELKEHKKIKSRCIIEITKNNLDYCKKLISAVDKVRHLDELKGNFVINESTYADICSVQKNNIPLPQLLISNVKSFVEQQQFYFDLLWNNSIYVSHKIKEIEESKESEGAGVEERKDVPQQQQQQQSKMEKKTKVLNGQQEISEKFTDFYRDSNEIMCCSQIDTIKVINNNYLDLHLETLKRYDEGKHNGIKWITLLNNKKDIELVKNFMDEGITMRHVKELLYSNFAVSDKALLFTIEKIEGEKMVTNVIYSNETLYVKHYGTVFESLWKKSIDINDRIDALDKDQVVDVEVMPNPKESLKFIKNLFNYVKSEVLLILSSATAISRVETNFGFKFFEDLALNGINVKILIPLGKDLQSDINQFKSKYQKIEFRHFYTDLKSITGIIIVDKKKVLLLEINDETKKFFVDSIGTVIFIDGKSTALPYFTIFDILWKQAELYDEVKKAYEKVQSHDKMQKEFVNVAAHELRTPLQPIVGVATILNKEIQGKRHKELIKVLIRNVQRLKTLSEDILDVSKIEGDYLDIHKEYFRIKEIMDEIMDIYKNEAASKNINLKYIFSEDSNNVVVYADKSRIIQLLSNLICNSIKFIDKEKKEKGLVSIDVKRRKSDDVNTGSESNNQVVISVKDNGIGIDKEILPRLFTKFASKSFHGTGLGLYISRNIIKAHGGKIWAENNNNNDDDNNSKKGATFSFSLPIVN